MNGQITEGYACVARACVWSHQRKASTAACRPRSAQITAMHMRGKSRFEQQFDLLLTN